jgi:hypothetical protein
MTGFDHVLPGQPTMETTTKPSKPPRPERPAAMPRKQAEAPRVFYERLTKRADVRRLLTKLAKL